MKRANNLIEDIAALQNLYVAFWKAGKGKAASKAVMLYRSNLDINLLGLREEILQGVVKVGDYRYFKVFDPKERQICASAFREQVLHHSLMNVCHPWFDRQLIYDSYASRPDKGVHAALKRAASFNRSNHWFLKLDVRKFFASIHHGVLKQQLARIFKDRRLLGIFCQIIDSYEVETDRGLPIGNLASQYFANHYLSRLDHYIKEKLRCKAYVRYMDDMVLWHADKQWLKEAKNKIQHLVTHELKLDLKLALLNRAECGLPFCGYVLRPYHVFLSQRSKRRYYKKLSAICMDYESHSLDEATCQRRVLPLIAFTQYADAVQYRKNTLSRIEQSAVAKHQ